MHVKDHGNPSQQAVADLYVIVNETAAVAARLGTGAAVAADAESEDVAGTGKVAGMTVAVIAVICVVAGVVLVVLCIVIVAVTVCLVKRRVRRQERVLNKRHQSTALVHTFTDSFHLFRCV